MNNQKIKISFVIPVYNSELTIIPTLNHLSMSTSFDYEIIIIDDLSTDNTVEIIKGYIAQNNKINIKLIQLTENSGPGIARNVGFEHVIGEYTLFFDSDDLIELKVIDDAVNYLDYHMADVGFFTYRINNGLGSVSKMWEADENIFYRGLESYSVNFSIKQYPDILNFTNYPWNKIVRTEFLQSINFQFSKLRLHEDILAHWIILMNANKIKLFDKVLCNYYLNGTGKNVTNNKSLLRIQSVDAISELYEYIKSHKNRELIIPIFMKFSLNLMSWAKKIIDREYKKALDNKAGAFFINIKLKDLYAMNNEDYELYTKASSIIVNNEVI